VKIAVIIVGSLLLLLIAIAFVNRPRLITVQADLPKDFPEDSFSHAVFEKLLKTYVDSEGKIDYPRWQNSAEDRWLLDSYLAAVSAYSPENSSKRFATPNDELAYWMYSYNAWVIRSVLQSWPLSSVTDVTAPLELTTGFGFFYRQRFLFGDSSYSLYAVENSKIRDQYKDARIHFVLNCASESCPIARTVLPTGEGLERLLEDATTEFVSDERNVRISDAEKTVYLNSIFKWYEKDFVNELRKRGLPVEGGLMSYINSAAPEALRPSIGAALEYDVEFMEYDWSLNQSGD
jgi:hypothetical protein